MAKKDKGYSKYITEKNKLLNEFMKYLDSLESIENELYLPVILDVVNWKDISKDKLTAKEMRFVTKISKIKLKILKYKTLLTYNALS